MPVRLAFGDFELDEARFELRRRGASVAVQPKVLDLIFYLARHRARVVSKDELFDEVWRGVFVTEASLSQAVSLARRALDDSAEEQHTIRTVRGKGLQFVAPERAARGPARPAAPPSTPRGASAGSTMLETVQEAPRSAPRGAEAPHLLAILHCDAPGQGGASWSLAGVDEVIVGRGSERRTERSGELTRQLRITVPGPLLSRKHARIVRTPDDWLLVDEGSRNGVFVNGERVNKRSLEAGDLIECGRTLFRFTFDHGSGDADVDSRRLGDGVLASVIPSLRALDADLRRVAAGSDLAILLTGESGTGKTHLAHALHRTSARPGPLVTLEGAKPSLAREAFERARHGTLLLEGLERVSGEAVAILASAIDASPEVRVIATSSAAFEALAEAVAPELWTRLSGYRCTLPPLRERLGDLGTLIAALHVPAPLSIENAAAQRLLVHGWPGNVRELAQVLKVAEALSGGQGIRLEHLPEAMRVKT